MEFKKIQGGVTAAQGYRASAVHAGIKGVKPDVALVVSDRLAAVAGTFTTNKIQGATVRLCRARLAGGRAMAIAINSGNANACNGPQGDADAERMAAIAAEALTLDPKTVFVCSTGTIGIPMPMEKIEAGIKAAAGKLAPDGGPAAARAIMTTDTVDKQVAVEFTIEGRTVRIGGMAKGAGMIEPNMATMLCFLTTDAAVTPQALQMCLSPCVEVSFNRISVDGDQSCNDTVLLLANGAAGNTPLTPAHPEWPVFAAALAQVTKDLALQIVRDGEGATKLVTVTVRGAVSDKDARLAARAICNSLLVKTSWFGRDPNWGRVIDAVGYSGADVREERVDIDYDGVCILRGGLQNRSVSHDDLRKVLERREFSLNVDLHLGQGAYTMYTCDCSIDYVKINADYMT